MPSRCVIAHLSDIHIGNHQPAVLNPLIDSLLEDPRPDFLAVTGDVSEHSWLSELRTAEQFLRGILHKLEACGHRARYLVIPGNHDVGYFKQQWAWRRGFPHTGHGAIQGLCQPGLIDQDDLPYCECYPVAGLVFLKFDSNLVRGWPWNYANGNVGKSQLDHIQRILERCTHADPNFNDYRKIALVHHHVHYLPMSGSDKLFLMNDAGLFWRRMISWGVEMILHGHKHYSTHAVLRYHDGTRGPTREEREVMILSAGTATSRDVPTGERNSFYKIECEPLKYRVRHFAFDGSRFTPGEATIDYRHVPRFHIPNTPAAIHMAALEGILVPDDEDGDPVHYSRVLYEATLGADLSYSKRVTFEGNRQADLTHLNVPYILVGAHKLIEEGQLRWQAHDCLTNRSLPEPKIEPHPRNVDKVISRIALPPVSAGERFQVRLEGRVPGLMYRENDYDAVGVARFLGGLEQFEYILRSERQPDKPRCFAMHRSGPRELPIDTWKEEGTNLHVIRPRIPRVAELGLGLICYYERLV